MNHNQLIGSILTVLNTDSAVPKPYSPYIGSLFFGPNQEITFRNNAPKGHVTQGRSFTDEYSFGRNFRRSKNFNIYIDFYSPEGTTDSSGNKNHELIARYLDLIEAALIANTGSYGSLVIKEIRDDEEPQRAANLENNVWMGRKAFVFQERQA
jgi:hypothetical protein